MKWLLDTNAASRFLGGLHPEITKRAMAVPKGDLTVCSVVKAELFYGAWKSGAPAAKLAQIEEFFSLLPSYPFDEAAAHEFGKLHADLSQRGCRIGPNDTLIASIALANNLVLVTNNTREFSRVPGLIIEDWQS
jgi:tRNA(fMet)-specific endonuclease VapC